MSRAQGIVAEAVAAVIAAEVQAQFAEVDRAITGQQALTIGRAAVDSLRADGWHITCLPALDAAPKSSDGRPS